MAASQPQDADAHTLHFPEGIPGFPDSRRFQLVALAPDSAFSVLESLDEPGVAMVVCVPWAFFPDYAPRLDAEEQDDLEVDSPDDVTVFCPVTVADDAVYLNLVGPFVVNARTRRGRQLVLEDPDLPLRAQVVPPAGD